MAESEATPDASSEIRGDQVVPDRALRLAKQRNFRIGLMIGGALTVLIGIFIFQNNANTDLRYLWFDFRTPLWIGLLAAFGAGFVAGPLFMWVWRWRHS